MFSNIEQFTLVDRPVNRRYVTSGLLSSLLSRFNNTNRDDRRKLSDTDGGRGEGNIALKYKEELQAIV